MADRVDLTDVEAAAQDATGGPWYRLGDTLAVFTEDGETLVFDSGSKPDARYIAAVDPPTALAMAEALRIAREALHEVAVDHEPMPVNDGRDWCAKCQNYMRGDSGCTAADATAAINRMDALVDFGGES